MSKFKGFLTIIKNYRILKLRKKTNQLKPKQKVLKGLQLRFLTSRIKMKLMYGAMSLTHQSMLNILQFRYVDLLGSNGIQQSPQKVLTKDLKNLRLPKMGLQKSIYLKSPLIYFFMEV